MNSTKSAVASSNASGEVRGVGSSRKPSGAVSATTMNAGGGNGSEGLGAERKQDPRPAAGSKDEKMNVPAVAPPGEGGNNTAKGAAGEPTIGRGNAVSMLGMVASGAAGAISGLVKGLHPKKEKVGNVAATQGSILGATNELRVSDKEAVITSAAAPAPMPLPMSTPISSPNIALAVVYVKKNADAVPSSSNSSEVESTEKPSPLKGDLKAGKLPTMLIPPGPTAAPSIAAAGGGKEVPVTGNDSTNRATTGGTPQPKDKTATEGRRQPDTKQTANKSGIGESAAAPTGTDAGSPDARIVKGDKAVRAQKRPSTAPTIVAFDDRQADHPSDAEKRKIDPTASGKITPPIDNGETGHRVVRPLTTPTKRQEAEDDAAERTERADLPRARPLSKQSELAGKNKASKKGQNTDKDVKCPGTSLPARYSAEPVDSLARAALASPKSSMVARAKKSASAGGMPSSITADGEAAALSASGGMSVARKSRGPASSRTIGDNDRPVLGVKVQAAAVATAKNTVKPTATVGRGEGPVRVVVALEGEIEGEGQGQGEGGESGATSATSTTLPSFKRVTTKSQGMKVAVKVNKEIAVQTDDALLQSLSLPSMSPTPNAKRSEKTPPLDSGKKGSISSLPTFSTSGTNTSKEDLFIVSMEMQLSINWGEVDLPPKWLRKTDPSCREYYVDLDNRKTQWRHPFDASGISVKKWKMQQQPQYIEGSGDVPMALALP